MKKLFFSVALFTAMSASCFANGNEIENKADKKSETKDAAKTESVKSEAKVEMTSPDAVFCRVKRKDGSIATCWFCDCSELKDGL